MYCGTNLLQFHDNHSIFTTPCPEKTRKVLLSCIVFHTSRKNPDCPYGISRLHWLFCVCMRISLWVFLRTTEMFDNHRNWFLRGLFLQVISTMIFCKQFWFETLLCCTRHALHKKGLQGQVGIGRPASSQPAVKPQGNRSSTTAFVPPFPDMPCMKRVYRDEKALFHWSAARNKERFSPRW